MVYENHDTKPAHYDKERVSAIKFQFLRRKNFELSRELFRYNLKAGVRHLMVRVRGLKMQDVIGFNHLQGVIRKCRNLKQK